MTDLPDPTTRRPVPGQLTFAAPRRRKPPQHLADLDEAGRKAAVEALGHKGFRAKQLSTHYFEHFVDEGDAWRFKWRLFQTHYVGPPDMTGTWFDVPDYGAPPAMPPLDEVTYDRSGVGAKAGGG